MNRDPNQAHQVSESDLAEGALAKDAYKTQLLTETGVVAVIEGDYAFVQIQRQNGCSGCASSSACGTSALASLFSHGNNALIKVKNTQDCQPGDSVVLTLDESRLIKHSFMAYGVPLIGLFVVAVVFKQFGLNVFALEERWADIASIVGGFIGVGLGWWFTRKVYRPILPELRRVQSDHRAQL